MEQIECKDGILSLLEEKDLKTVFKFLSLSYLNFFSISDKRISEKEIYTNYLNNFDSNNDQIVYLKLGALSNYRPLMLYRIEKKNNSYFISFSVRRSDLGMKYLRHSLPKISKYIISKNPEEVLILVGKKDYEIQKLVIKAGFNNDIYNINNNNFLLYSLYGDLFRVN